MLFIAGLMGALFGCLQFFIATRQAQISDSIWYNKTDFLLSKYWTLTRGVLSLYFYCLWLFDSNWQFSGVAVLIFFFVAEVTGNAIRLRLKVGFLFSQYVFAHLVDLAIVLIFAFSIVPLAWLVVLFLVVLTLYTAVQETEKLQSP